MKQGRDFHITAGLLVITMAIGGAGDSFPLLEMLLELCGLATIGYLILTRRSWALNLETRVALGLLALILLLPLMQLIPLPPQLWHGIVGREPAARLDQLLGWRIWRPLTLDVEGTVRTFLELLPPAAIFLGCIFLTLQERTRLLVIVVVFALFSGVLGIFQLVTGGSLTPYPSSHTGHPVGLFVNRNHNAALLLIGIPLAGALAAIQLSKGKPRLPVSVAAVSAFIVFSIVVLGTTSRGGLLLLPLALASGLWLLLRRQSASHVGGPALITLGAAALIVFLNGGVTRTLTRFSSLQDDRLNYWQDIGWALKHFGFAGTGLGTFVPIFQSAESLDSIVPQYINHAHNDYLELVLEGGLPAACLLLAFLVLVVLAFIRSSSGRAMQRPIINLGAVSAILLMMLFSLVDFPLRMLALSAPFALLGATLLPTRTSVKPAGRRELAVVSRNRPSIGLIGAKLAMAALLLAAALLSFEAGLSSRAIASGRYQEAASIASWSTRAHEREATAELMRLDDGAADSARRALRLSPINASAIRTLGLLRLSEGDAYAGNHLMEASASLGWRDILTQLWAIDAAERTREPVKAAQRAEALFRQNIFLPPLQLLLQAQDFNPISRLLAGMLAQRPAWRPALLRSGGGLSAATLPRFQQVLARLNTTPARVTTDEMKPVLRSLTSHDRTAEAAQLWLQLNPALIDNGEFNKLSEADRLAPAGWEVPTQNRENVTLMRPDANRENRVLRIGPTEWVTVLTQETMIPAGAYTLSYVARELGSLPVTLRWQFRCRGAKETRSSVARLLPDQGWKSFALPLLVPPRDCPIQKLALKRVEADNRSETWVDSVRIAPAAH